MSRRHRLTRRSSLCPRIHKSYLILPAFLCSHKQSLKRNAALRWMPCLSILLQERNLPLVPTHSAPARYSLFGLFSLVRKVVLLLQPLLWRSLKLILRSSGAVHLNYRAPCLTRQRALRTPNCPFSHLRSIPLPGRMGSIALSQIRL